MAKQVLTLNGFGGGINKDADGTDLNATGDSKNDEVRSAENIFLDQHGKIIASTPLVQSSTGMYGYTLTSNTGGAWTLNATHTTPLEATDYSGSGDNVFYTYTTDGNGVPTFTIIHSGEGLAAGNTMRFNESGSAKYYLITVNSLHSDTSDSPLGILFTGDVPAIIEGSIYDTSSDRILVYDDKIYRSEGVYKHGEVILYNKYVDYMSFLPSTGELGVHATGTNPTATADGVNILFRSDRRPVTDKTPLSGVNWEGKGSEGSINIFMGADARGWSSQGSGPNSGMMFDLCQAAGGGRWLKQVTTKNEDAQRITNYGDGGSTQALYHITDNVGDIQDDYPPALASHDYDICGQVVASKTDVNKLNFTNLAEGAHPSAVDPKLADFTGGDFSSAGGVNATDKQSNSITVDYHEVHDLMWLYWDVSYEFAGGESDPQEWMEEFSNGNDPHGTDKQSGMAMVFTPGKRSDQDQAWDGAYGNYCPSIYGKNIRLQIRISNGAYINSEKIAGLYILAETAINSTNAVTNVKAVDTTCKTWYISRAELVANMDSRGWVEFEKSVANHIYEGDDYAGDDKILTFYLYVSKHEAAAGLPAVTEDTFSSVFRLREFSFVQPISSGWAAYDYVKIFETRIKNGIESIPKQKVSTMTFEGGGDNAVACPDICKIRTNAQEVFIQRPAAADSSLTHGKLYYQGCDENGLTFGEKFLLAEYDYTKGVKWAGQEDDEWQQWVTTYDFPFGYGSNASTMIYEEPPVSSTYSLETGYPDGVETINALFKTATTVGRQVFIGNVAKQKVTEEGADANKAQPFTTGTYAASAENRFVFNSSGYCRWGVDGTNNWANHGYSEGDSFIVTSGLTETANQNVVFEITGITDYQATITPAPTNSGYEDAVKIIYGFEAYDPSLILKTPPGSAAGFPNNTYIDLEFGGDKINVLESTADRLFIFSDYKLTIVNVSQDIEFIEATLDHMGVSKHRQVCKIGEGVAWVNSAGVFFFDGENVNPLSSDKLITENFTNASGNAAIAYDSTRDLLWVWIDDDKIYYYCFVTKSFIAYSSRSVGNFYKMPSTNSVAAKEGYTHYAYGTTNLKRNFFIGNSITTTAADDRSILWQSGKIHCGTLGIRKRFYDVYITATNTYTYSVGNNNGIKLEWSIDNGATWHRAKTNNYKSNGATNTNDRLLQNGVTRCGLVNSEGDGKTKAKGKYIMLRIVHVSLGTTSAMEIADISLIYRQKKVK